MRKRVIETMSQAGRSRRFNKPIKCKKRRTSSSNVSEQLNRIERELITMRCSMSKLSEDLKKVNVELRASIQSEHEQVKAKMDELIAKIAELESVSDADFDAELEETKTIAAEIRAIFE